MNTHDKLGRQIHRFWQSNVLWRAQSQSNIMLTDLVGAHNLSRISCGLIFLARQVSVKYHVDCFAFVSCFARSSQDGQQCRTSRDPLYATASSCCLLALQGKFCSASKSACSEPITIHLKCHKPFACSVTRMCGSVQGNTWGCEQHTASKETQAFLTQSQRDQCH